MGMFQIKLKTFCRENVTPLDGELNDCIVHNKKPVICRMVVGRNKDVMFTAICEDDSCSKISYEKDDVIKAWNKWNPKAEVCDASKDS